MLKPRITELDTLVRPNVTNGYLPADRSLEQAEKVLRREVSSMVSFGRPGLASWHKQGFMMPKHLPERLLEARNR